MGQGLSASSCCSCFTDCWDARRSSAPAIKPSPSALSSASTDATDVQQPLVVEDESWKKWSSYNLIHDREGKRDDSLYSPPMYVSHQQTAEAVWDL